MREESSFGFMVQVVVVVVVVAMRGDANKGHWIRFDSIRFLSCSASQVTRRGNSFLHSFSVAWSTPDLGHGVHMYK